MSTQDSDGIDEALQGVSHVALTAAARIGEQHARMREQQARTAQASSQQAAREHTERMRAEREAARASLTVVYRPQWWDTAQPGDITNAYQTAKAWNQIDPEAVRAEQRITWEVQARYGIDMVREGEPGSVAEAVERAERARDQAAEQRAAATNERAEAVGLMARADAIDQAAQTEDALHDQSNPQPQEQADDQREHHALDMLNPDRDPQDINQDINQGVESAALADDEAEHGRAGEQREDAGYAYDSAQRREAMAHGLDHIQNRAAVDARVRSDIAQGRPATDAVANTPGRAPKARNTKSGPTTTPKVQRVGQGR